MDVLRELIQTLVIIVVLAVFLEMLLPRGDMRRYVKMVMGLLVIIAVMQTAAGVVNSELLREVPRVTVSDNGSPPLEDIMAAGKQLSDLSRDEAARRYSEGVAGQVLSLAKLHAGVNAVDARVKIGPENNSIDEITIIFSTGSVKQAEKMGAGGSDTGVRPVVINIGDDAGGAKRDTGTPTAEERKAAARVAGAVAEFYNLQPGQVKIEFQG